MSSPRYAVLLLALLLPIAANAAVVGVVTTVAGVPQTAGLRDGSAADALFNKPTWLDIVPDSRPSPTAGLEGDIYVIDRANQVIRRISNGVVSTYRPARAYFDSTELPLNFDGPLGGGIVIETSNGGCGTGPYDRGFFVSLTGAQQVALVSFDGSLAARDDFTPVIGTENTPGALDGSGTGVQFNMPTGLARSWNYTVADARLRSIYVADTGNNLIRRIGFVYSFEGCPQAKVVETVAGVAGQAGSNDGIGLSARFNMPRGVAVGPDGGIYVADTGSATIRRIDPVSGVVRTIAGEPDVQGTNDGPPLLAHFVSPSGIDVDASGRVLIADSGSHTIRMLTPDRQVVTIAGTPMVAGFEDGEHAKFNGPVGLKVARDGSIYVADTSNNVIRRIVLTDVPPRRRVVRH